VWSTVPVCCTSSAISALRLSRNSTRSCHKPLIEKDGVPRPDRPPDKKRSPGSAGNRARGKAQFQAVTSRKTSTKRRRAVQEPDRSLSVYDGTIRIGNISVVGGEFIVVLPDGALLGSFKTLKQASVAISNARDNINSHDGGAR
jgi:hypothetical protein